MNFAKVHYDHLSFSKRKNKTDDLKISVRPELATKISNREFSAVRQQMQGLDHKSVTINGQVRKGGLHSILFDNTGNKTDKYQILGVILDACNHFVRKNSRDSRYITFSSGLNELKSESFNQNEGCDTIICEGDYNNLSAFKFKKKYNFCLVAVLAVAMCFFVSCGGGSSKPVNSGDESVSNFGKLGQECYPNETCDKGLICDTENNVCVEDPDNPTDTDSDKPDEQNNQNDQDKPVEQPDENHQENQNDQDTPVEQPDEDHQENQNDQDQQENQNDQDAPVEQPDEDTPINTGDACHSPGCQGDRGCKPGYVWAGENASIFVDTGGDPDYNCVACVDLGENWHSFLRDDNSYCPGGDDLKGKSLYSQFERCPEYTHVNDSFDDCICEYGIPPLPKEECHPVSTRRKPLIIKVHN